MRGAQNAKKNPTALSKGWPQGYVIGNKNNIMVAATGPWIAIRVSPTPSRSYLISATFGGIETSDVAYYNGMRSDGCHWWTLDNVEIVDFR
jgi:hypothetical protein